MNLRYSSLVYSALAFCTGQKGWEKPFLLTQFMRGMTDKYPITSYRLAPEVNITGSQRGVGRIGLDYWSVIANKKGQRAGQVWERYPKANWRNLNITQL